MNESTLSALNPKIALSVRAELTHLKMLASEFASMQLDHIRVTDGYYWTDSTTDFKTTVPYLHNEDAQKIMWHNADMSCRVVGLIVYGNEPECVIADFCIGTPDSWTESQNDQFDADVDQVFYKVAQTVGWLNFQPLEWKELTQ